MNQNQANYNYPPLSESQNQAIAANEKLLKEQQIIQKQKNELNLQKNIFQNFPIICMLLSFIMLVCVCYIFTHYRDNTARKVLYYALIPTAILYIIELFFSPIPYYLLRIYKVEQIKQYIKYMKSQKPIITFSIKSYHFKDENDINNKEVNNSQGEQNKKNQEQVDDMLQQQPTQKITTFQTSRNFIYESSTDCSEDILSYLCKGQLVRMTNSVVWEPGDDRAYQEWQHLQSGMVSYALTKDKYIDWQEAVTIPGMVNNILVNMTENEDNLLSFSWFCFFSLIGLSFIYRLYVTSITNEMHFVFKKKIIG